MVATNMNGAGGHSANGRVRNAELVVWRARRVALRARVALVLMRRLQHAVELLRGRVEHLEHEMREVDTLLMPKPRATRWPSKLVRWLIGPRT